MDKLVKVPYCTDCGAFIFEFRRYVKKEGRSRMIVNDEGYLEETDFDEDAQYLIEDECPICDKSHIDMVEMPFDVFKLLNDGYPEFYKVDFGDDNPSDIPPDELKSRIVEALL